MGAGEPTRVDAIEMLAAAVPCCWPMCASACLCYVGAEPRPQTVQKTLVRIGTSVCNLSSSRGESERVVDSGGTYRLFAAA